MYDPSIGRWLEEDPVGFEAGDVDLYRYVFNAPTYLIDPSGLATFYTSLVTNLNDRTLDVHDNLGRRFHFAGEKAETQPPAEPTTPQGEAKPANPAEPPGEAKP